MDLEGRRKIAEALETDLLLPLTRGKIFFEIEPQEFELRGSEGSRESAPEAVKFLDIITPANPSRVLEVLHRAGLLEGSGRIDTEETPELRYRSLGHKDDKNVLTFEDLVEHR